MKLDLRSFLEGSEDILEFQGQIESMDLGLTNREIELVEPIEYSGVIFKANRDKMIDLSIKYKYSETCARCLAPSTETIETNLYGKLLEGNCNEEDLSKKDQDQDEEEYEEILYYENDTLSLDKYILEQVILSLPIKTLCDENCKGLCSKCGIDLNKESCDCVHEDIDPRLEKLKDFFSKD